MTSKAMHDSCNEIALFVFFDDVGVVGLDGFVPFPETMQLALYPLHELAGNAPFLL